MHFPLGLPPHKVGKAKGKGVAGLKTELDRKFEATLAEVTGPGGRLVIDHDETGRAFVANFPGTLPLFFKTFCALNGQVEAMVAGDERLTFAELDRWSDLLAKALVTRGIRKGDRVGIAMRNCPVWVVGYMAALKAGAIATLLNGWWESHELAHALELTDPALILADPPRGRRIAGAGDWPIVSLDIEQPLGIALAPLLEGLDDNAVLPDIAPEDDATILFTSGSTGEAKGALSTHRAVTTGTYAYATGLMVLKDILISEGRPPGPPRTLLSVPLFHVTGEVPVLLNSFVVGRGLVVMPKWDAGEALRLIEKEKITYFVGVPTMSLELMNHPDRDKYDLSSLTDITGGGAPRPISHVERLRRTFPNSQPALGYGLTETNAVGCANFWGNYAAKPASTGRPQIPFVELAILGADDAHQPPGERGEIGIRTAANITCYWRNRQATAAAFTADGYFRTGDIGYLDEDGYLFIVDRKKDIIIRGGENISAAEVEAALYGHPDVAEAAVFGAADERLGEVPVAVVHCRDGSLLDEAGLRDFLHGRLAAFKIPARIIFAADPLPRLGTGKFDRVALKETYAR
jgi:acyl-CoA synthetase (AMP-forming)/AMP-acid ligase II